MDLNLPGGHFEQLACPSSDHKPGPQFTHADAVVDLLLGFTVPAAQAVQGARPVADHDPGLQWDVHSDFDVDPGGEDMPSWHSRQSFKLNPVAGLYVPAEHTWQLEADWEPTVLLLVPAGQAAQALCPVRAE